MSEPIDPEKLENVLNDEDSDFSCGAAGDDDCSCTRFNVLETGIEKGFEGRVPPSHYARIECKNCGTVTENPLLDEQVEKIRG